MGEEENDRGLKFKHLLLYGWTIGNKINVWSLSSLKDSDKKKMWDCPSEKYVKLPFFSISV